MSDTNEQWLTYAEAAAALGIKADSVRRRATARKWPRRQGNDGLARVLLPIGIVPDRPPDDTPAPGPAVTPDLALVERAARAEAKADALTVQLADLRSDRDRWRDLAEKLTQDSLKPRPGILSRILSRKRQG